MNIDCIGHPLQCLWAPGLPLEQRVNDPNPLEWEVKCSLSVGCERTPNGGALSDMCRCQKTSLYEASSGDSGRVRRTTAKPFLRVNPEKRFLYDSLFPFQSTWKDGYFFIAGTSNFNRSTGTLVFLTALEVYWTEIQLKYWEIRSLKENWKIISSLPHPTEHMLVGIVFWVQIATKFISLPSYHLRAPNWAEEFLKYQRAV